MAVRRVQASRRRTLATARRCGACGAALLARRRRIAGQQVAAGVLEHHLAAKTQRFSAERQREGRAETKANGTCSSSVWPRKSAKTAATVPAATTRTGAPAATTARGPPPLPPPESSTANLGPRPRAAAAAARRRPTTRRPRRTPRRPGPPSSRLHRPRAAAPPPRPARPASPPPRLGPRPAVPPAQPGQCVLLRQWRRRRRPSTASSLAAPSLCQAVSPVGCLRRTPRGSGSRTAGIFTCSTAVYRSNFVNLAAAGSEML